MKALILFAIVGCLSAADTAVMKVATGVAGHLWGASIEEVLTDGRHPLGYLHVDERTTLIMYGDSSSLRFIDYKLAGVDYGSIVAGFIAREIRPGEDAQNFVCEDGLRMGMPYEQVRELFKDKMPATSKPRMTVTVGAASIKMEFIGTRTEPAILWAVQVLAEGEAPPKEPERTPEINHF